MWLWTLSNDPAIAYSSLFMNHTSRHSHAQGRVAILALLKPNCQNLAFFEGQMQIFGLAFK